MEVGNKLLCLKTFLFFFFLVKWEYIKTFQLNWNQSSIIVLEKKIPEWLNSSTSSTCANKLKSEQISSSHATNCYAFEISRTLQSTPRLSFVKSSKISKKKHKIIFKKHTKSNLWKFYNFGLVWRLKHGCWQNWTYSLWPFLRDK